MSWLRCMFRLLRTTIFSFEVLVFSSLDALTSFSVLMCNADFSRLTSFRAVQVRVRSTYVKCTPEKAAWCTSAMKMAYCFSCDPMLLLHFLLPVSIKKHFVKSSFWRCLFFTAWSAWPVRLHWSGHRLVEKKYRLLHFSQFLCSWSLIASSISSVNSPCFWCLPCLSWLYYTVQNGNGACF